MKKHFWLYLTLILALAFLASCNSRGGEPTLTPFSESSDQEGDAFIGMPNPASFYCQEMGYEIDMRENDQGTEGVCVFPDGAECDEWDFLSGRCNIEWTFCQRQGYNIQPGENGATCLFPDGSSCPEYDFFIGKCLPPE